MKPGPDGPDPATDDLRDRLVRHLFEEPEHQHVPVLPRQRVERGVDPTGVLGREVVVLLPGDVDPVEELGGLATPPEPAERPVACDPVEPRRERPGVGQAWDAADDVAPDVLQNVLDV